jgi:hypothetical protein
VSNGIIGIPDSLCIETQKEIDRTTGAHFFKNVFVYVIELAQAVDTLKDTLAEIVG